jgi:hypothetical protein
MLKFIRKYQLIILAIGGSLLMVVFLFQPIIGKLSPDPRKATVAQLADGTKFNGFDYQRASFDLAVIKRVSPLLLLPTQQGGLGIDQSSSGDEAELHWLLLSKMANDAGLVGDAGEGATWIPELARRNAAFQIQQQVQQGMLQFTSDQEYAQAVAALAPQYEAPLQRNVSMATGMAQGATEGDVYRTLATARGIERLFRVYSSVPSYSDLGAMQAAKQRYDAIAMDAVMIKGSAIAPAIQDPSDEQLQAFFDEYKADAPSDNDYAIGYTQPTRVKLGWLALNRDAIASTVTIDRVELNKIWRTDHQLPAEQQRYPGDFAGERLNIERAFRTDRAMDLMIEADKIIRSKIIQATRVLEKDGDYYILPADWSSTRPKLEALAQAVVDGVKEQHNVELPLPIVETHTDRWLNAMEISTLQGYGASAYRIGQRQLPSYLIPQGIDTEELSAIMPVQAGVHMVDPAAEDAQGNRYYAIFYEVNPAGPADTIDDVGRERVLNDYKSVKAFELLSENISAITELAKTSGDLAPAISLAMDLGPADAIRPGVARNLLVTEDNVARGRLASFVEPGLNSEEFRSVVQEATSGLDPLATPEALAESPIFVSAVIPSSKGIALGKVIAPRPMTQEVFDINIFQILAGQGRRDIQIAIDDAGVSPFTLETLSDRMGYTRIKKRNDEEEVVPATESDTETAES